ncbi:MAG: carboxypeptidase-like regulatory domain-containing protein [Acidobacteriota bacterium]
MSRLLRTSLAIALWAIAVSNIASLRAQTTNATLVGTVTDAQGAVVPRATVTVKSNATSIERRVETDESGTYRVYPLQPGGYDVTVTSAGFQAKVVSNVVLDVASNVKLDFALTVGVVTESVSVAANAALLQTQDASVGGTITTSTIEALPVNGRNFTGLILLLPGTSDMNKNARRGAQSGSNTYSVNGQRAQDNNYTIDGVDSNFLMGNSPGASPPMDAIQEFRILNNTSAEYGRSAGSNVNIVIKSGTSSLHGTAYEYFRNDKLDANEFFANRNGSGKVPFRQNQYGVSVGGPVVLPGYNGRDKSFWFFDWEGFRRRRGSTLISTSPIAAQRAGDFSQQSKAIYDPLTSVLITSGPSAGQISRMPFAGKVIPTNRINPGMAFLINTMMPLPNRPGLTNNYINSEGLANDRDMWNIRGDHYFNEKNTVFFRFTHQKVGEQTPGTISTVYAIGRFDVINLAGAWNHIFNPKSVLEVKFGYNAPANPVYTVNRKITRTDFLKQANITMLQNQIAGDNIPVFNNGDFSVNTAGGEGGFSNTNDHVSQYIVNYSRVMGGHTVKFGAMYSNRHFFQDTGNPQNGTIVFDGKLTSNYNDPTSGIGFATQLLGYPANVTRALGNTLLEGRQHILNFFAQDDWRVSSKLTVNLGVRWEPQPTPYDANDKLGNLWIRRDGATGRYYGSLMWAGVNPEINPETGTRNDPPQTFGFGKGLQRNNYWDFAPRIGLAYQINQKTVIRSAYGIFYNSTFFQELQDRRKFWPYNVQQVFSPNTGTLPDLSITDPGPSFSGSIGGWPQNPENRTPYSQQWNLTIQRQLMSDLTLDVAYVGSGNIRQLGYNPVNTANPPGPGAVNPRRPLPTFGDLDGGRNDYNSNYHALQVKATKRYTKGLQVDGSYTWSRCMDTVDSLNEYQMQDQYHLRGEYGRCSLDIRQLFQADFVYDLPFGKGRHFGSGWNRGVDMFLGGWAMQGIVRLNTPSPINIRSGEDRANVGRSYQRPSVIGNPDNGPHTVETWFDASKIVRANIYTYGNLGRDAVSGASLHNFDFSIHKTFAITEKQRIEFRSEFFNILNMTNLDPQLHGSTAVWNYSASNFNTVTQARDARQVQMSLRYGF